MVEPKVDGIDWISEQELEPGLRSGFCLRKTLIFGRRYCEVQKQEEEGSEKGGVREMVAVAVARLAVKPAAALVSAWESGISQHCSFSGGIVQEAGTKGTRGTVPFLQSKNMKAGRSWMSGGAPARLLAPPVRAEIPFARGEQHLVQKVTAKELDDILANERTQPMVLDFYATWCGPCILLAQELETLAVEYGEAVRFLKIDTDEEYELASQMEIRGLPTMVFVSKDKEKLAIRTEGLLPSRVIRDIIEKEL